MRCTQTRHTNTEALGDFMLSAFSHVAHNVDINRAYLSFLMGLVTVLPPNPNRHPYPAITKCMKRGRLLLRTVGIDIAKQLPDGSWMVRDWYHRNTRISYRILDVENVLRSNGFVHCGRDPRTTWHYWRRPA